MKVYLVYKTVFGKEELHKIFKTVEEAALYVRSCKDLGAAFAIDG